MAELEDEENTPLLINTDDHNDDEIEMNTLDQTGRKTSTSQFPSFLVHGKKTDQLDSLEESRDEAWEKIKNKFPEFNPKNAPFIAKMDEYDQVIVRLARQKSKECPLFIDNELNERLPKTIKESLGPTAEEIITVNDENNSKDRARIVELIEEGGRTDISNGVRETIIARINEIEERIGERNLMNERIQERMSLRTRIKAIFKKYGFTITAVVTAVGVVIAVIVSNLKTGLEKVAKGVGNGLKDIGKKLAQILHGMVGAIASFISKTAGEVVGFLAKNAWLLIVAVVVYFVEHLKNKKKR